MHHRLDELLAHDHLSGAERERILARALAVVAPRRWWRRRGLAWLLPLAAAALVLLLVLPRPPRDGFRARGAATAAPLLLVSCDDGEPARCADGRKLVFSVGGATERGFLQAWAEPADGAGERIWYFSADDGVALALVPAARFQVLPKAALLGPEQPPGGYEVHLVLSRRPLSRAELLDGNGADVLATNRVRIDVTP